MNTLTPPTLIRALSIATLVVASQAAAAAQPLVCLIQPSSIAEVGTSVTGVIQTMRVERGDYVKQGQVIAVLRSDVERAALGVAKSRAQAEADVRAAMAALDFARQSTARTEDLFKKNFISGQALDKTRTEEQVAAQKLAQAREQRQVWEREMGLASSQLAQRTITSPISGIVAERYLSTGERVEDRSVARIVSINPLHIEVMVPASNFGKITHGMVASVLPELPDAVPVEARVKLVDKLIDGASNTFRVRLELPNPGNALPAGPRCKVDFGERVLDAKTTASKPTLWPATPPVSTPRVSTAPASPALAPRAQASRQVAAPRAASPAVAEKSVLGAVERWRRAWESQDLIGYLAAYTPSYQGDTRSRKDWVQQREARILKPGKLDIRISEAKVQPVADNTVRVRFRQAYQGGNYRDNSLKSLLMVLEKGQWLIREERALP